MECVAFLMIRKTHLLVLRRWFDQHKSVKKNQKKITVSCCIADLEMFGDGSTAIIFEHGQYKEYLRSSFIKHVVTGN